MSDDQNGKSAGPSHIAYQVREKDGGKSYFNRVGSAFPHKDGQGFNLILDSVPVDGKVTLRTPQERVNAMKQGGGNSQSRDSKEQER
ncbi:hypothetical protein [Roseibium sp.]|uniref:hypothetical protein n=1 Tax=Roseibium sp. TaxID=1936156 RepID=UPI003A96A049